MEHLSGGSLLDLVHQLHDNSINKCDNYFALELKLPEQEASKIIKCILEAVAYIHSYDIAHRDLKPGIIFLLIFYLLDNIMFAKQKDNSSLKLIDFGLSAKYNINQAISFFDKCGTAIYMAPEVFSNSEYSKVLKKLIKFVYLIFP